MTELLQVVQQAVGDAFVVQEEMRPGGMSRLFLAQERALNRQVVIKVLPPEYGDDVSVARFQREIDVSAHLQHPNLLPILTAGARGGVLYYVTPFVAGDSLSRLLEREGRLPVAEAVRMLRDLADALSLAHQHGVLHRDIKPSNILLAGGRPVLADFGIAHALNAARTSEHDLTQSGALIGTVGYMSPEQAASNKELDARSDVYALAVVGYEMLTGATPFPGRSGVDTVRAHLLEPPPHVAQLRPDVPLDVSDVIDKALAKRPEDRQASAAEFRDALDATLGGFKSRRFTRRAALVAGAVVVAAVTAALGASFARRSAKAKPNRQLVAVAPFDVASPKLRVWKEGLVDILSRNLDGVGALRTVSSSAVVRDWKGPADESTARALGRKTGAGVVVFGRVSELGRDSASIEATAVDVQSGRVLGHAQQRGSVPQLYRLTGRLATDLLVVVGNAGRSPALARAASLGTTSPEAIEGFLEGEQRYREHRYRDAMEGYQRAISVDSNFALAYRGAAYAIDGYEGGDDSTTLRYRLRAGTLNHNLSSARDSLWLTADSTYAAALVDKDAGARVTLARRHVSTMDRLALLYSSDPEAWAQLGYARLKFGEQLGVPREQALQAYEQALAVDSTYGPAYFYVIELSAELRDTGVTRRYAQQYAGVDRDDVGPVLAALLDSHARGEREPGAWIDTVNVALLEKSGFMLRRLSDREETALELGRRVASDSDARVHRMLEGWLAPALAWRGHVREAYATGGAQSRESGEFLTALGVLGAVPDDSARAVLTRALHGSDPQAIAYSLPWWAQRGDTLALTAAMHRLDQLGRKLADPAAGDPTIAYGTAASRAYLALARADTATALAMFAAIPDSLCSYRCWADRVTRARLLEATGSADQAASVLDRRPLAQSTQTVGEILWMLERGRVAEKLGDHNGAVDAYARVRDAWLHADPVLRPLVDEANHALSRLRGERASAAVPHAP